MNLANRRLLSISNADARFVCVDRSRMRLCATPRKWFNVLASQNGFMTQNLCKHSQLCLEVLNRQEKKHITSYISKEIRACMQLNIYPAEKSLTVLEWKPSEYLKY